MKTVLLLIVIAVSFVMGGEVVTFKYKGDIYERDLPKTYKESVEMIYRLCGIITEVDSVRTLLEFNDSANIATIKEIRLTNYLIKDNLDKASNELLSLKSQNDKLDETINEGFDEIAYSVSKLKLDNFIGFGILFGGNYIRGGGFDLSTTPHLTIGRTILGVNLGMISNDYESISFKYGASVGFSIIK